MYQNVQKNAVMYACERICQSGITQKNNNMLNMHVKFEILHTGTANALGQAYTLPETLCPWSKQPLGGGRMRYASQDSHLR